LVNKPVVAWSLLAFERCADIDNIVLVVRKEQIEASKAVVKMFGISKVRKIVAGGNKRQDSVAAGLKACECDVRYVVIHDAARPLVTTEMIADVVKGVKRNPAVTLGRPVIDTIKMCEKGVTVAKTVSRDKLWTVQTPQAFLFAELMKAYAAVDKGEYSDDCAVAEAAGIPVKIVTYLEPNFKITTPEDLHLVGALIK